MITSKPKSAKRTEAGGTTLAQVFTPPAVAGWMAEWICRGRPRRVLDPCVGAGVFVEALSQEAAIRRIPMHVDAMDIDVRMLRSVCGAGSITLRLRRGDFLQLPAEHTYDGIIANPPYVRHHEFRHHPSVWRRFDELAGERLSRLTNLYGLFLLRIAELLGPIGRSAVITPVEWLNADFGVAIKRYLCEQNLLDGILYFDHGSSVFDGVLTTAAITLLRRGRRRDEGVRIARLREISELTGLDWENVRCVPRTELDASRKWLPLLRGQSGLARPGRTVGDEASCMRGIATGANDYFTLRRSDMDRWGIDLRDMRPCITKARQLRGAVFSTGDFQRLADADERVYLLSPRRSLTKAVRAYLEHGRRLGIDRRFLPSHRPCWYMPEQRPAAPILVSVFARGAFRFVRNQAGVLNLTAYHGIYPRDGSARSADRLFEMLTAREAQRSLLAQQRVYANGLCKLEPKDVEAIALPEVNRGDLRSGRKRGRGS